jgi:iron complex transport system ATP-binding protein
MSAPVLACESVSVSKGGASLLSDVSLAVMPGERLGIVGPNGSGKSTLLHVLAGLLKPSAGEVTLFGQPLSSLTRRDVAQRLAVVEQHAQTSDRIRVRDAVELGRTPWLSALAPWSAEDDAQVSAALQAVELEHLAQRHWHSLSGGERQRVQIARALAQQPKVLLLDEPTNHLDIHHQLSLLQLIRTLPVTSVMALHDLNQALTCDRLALLDRGRLVALGPPTTVLSPERLRATFNVEGHWLPGPNGGEPVLALRAITQ